MTGGRRFAKWRLVPGPFQHPLGRLDMHALDHLVAEAFGAAVKGGNQSFRAFELLFARGECLVALCYLVRMYQALSIEPKTPSLLRLRNKTVRIVESVEHAVEHRDSRSARGEDDHLQRCRDRLTARAERKA